MMKRIKKKSKPDRPKSGVPGDDGKPETRLVNGVEHRVHVDKKGRESLIYEPSANRTESVPTDGQETPRNGNSNDDANDRFRRNRRESGDYKREIGDRGSHPPSRTQEGPPVDAIRDRRSHPPSRTPEGPPVDGRRDRRDSYERRPYERTSNRLSDSMHYTNEDRESDRGNGPVRTDPYSKRDMQQLPSSAYNRDWQQQEGVRRAREIPYHDPREEASEYDRRSDNRESGGYPRSTERRDGPESRREYDNDNERNSYIKDKQDPYTRARTDPYSGTSQDPYDKFDKPLSRFQDHPYSKERDEPFTNGREDFSRTGKDPYNRQRADPDTGGRSEERYINGRETAYNGRSNGLADRTKEDKNRYEREHSYNGGRDHSYPSEKEREDPYRQDRDDMYDGRGRHVPYDKPTEQFYQKDMLRADRNGGMGSFEGRDDESYGKNRRFSDRWADYQSKETGELSSPGKGGPYTKESGDPYIRGNDVTFYRGKEDTLLRGNQGMYTRESYDPYIRAEEKPNMRGRVDLHSKEREEAYNRDTQSPYSNGKEHVYRDSQVPYSNGKENVYSRGRPAPYPDSVDPYGREKEDPYGREKEEPFNREREGPYKMGNEEPYNRRTDFEDPYTQDRRPKSGLFYNDLDRTDKLEIRRPNIRSPPLRL